MNKYEKPWEGLLYWCPHTLSNGNYRKASIGGGLALSFLSESIESYKLR